MKTITSLIIAIIISSFLYGQTTVTFGYDAAGNRISRTINWQEKTVDTSLVVNDSTPTKEANAENTTPEKYTATMGDQGIEIYPNPSAGVFTLKINAWEKATSGEFWLYDLQGNTIVQKPITRDETIIRFHNHPDGTYLLTITLNGKKETWKIIKR